MSLKHSQKLKIVYSTGSAENADTIALHVCYWLNWMPPLHLTILCYHKSKIDTMPTIVPFAVHL